MIAALAVAIGTALPASASQAGAVPMSGAVPAAGADTASSGIAKTALAGFNAGNIISDAVFTNKNTMTEAQIQAFLNSKVKTCQPGYTCLKDLRVATQSKAADTYCKAYAGQSGESAARIISKVATACGINPQVLIVMLQKEQGLVTSAWPSSKRYGIAMGFNCPDTAPCSPGSEGFFTQVYGAARQMQIYMEGRYFTWYAPGKTWSILYNPNTACGSSKVYIANKATAALYYYTPYQPNAAALKAGYGEARPCGAYGNRNFYNYFTDWFGSTQQPTPTAPPVSGVTNMDASSFVLAAASDGTIWAYAFSKGRWGPRVQIGSKAPGTTELFSAGDLDGDGHRDLVALDGSRQASRLSGTGGVGLNAKEALSVDFRGSILRTPAGDFDGDRVPDMFTTDSAGALWLWSGDDRGSFRKPAQVGTGWTSMNLISGGQDMTGDGVADVIARDAQGRLKLYPGDGHGGWGTAKQIGQGWQGITVMFSPGDFDGDGIADVLARKADGSLWSYPGSASGALRSGTQVGSGWSDMLSLSGSGPAAAGPRVLAPGPGDVDGDRKPDVVALDSSGQLSLYRGDGNGGWLGSQAIATGWAKGAKLIPMGDFNGDGRREIGRIDAGGDFFLSTVGQDGRLNAASRIGRGWAGFTAVVGSLDFDGDRRPDVLARTANGDLMLYPGSGTGAWGVPRVVGWGWGAFDQIAYAGDFDGDGVGDVIARKDDGSLWLYPLNGSGGWGIPVQIGKGWSSLLDVFGPGDFDGDRKADVLARTASGDLILYRGDGRGGWDGSRKIGRGWNAFVVVR